MRSAATRLAAVATRLAAAAMHQEAAAVRLAAAAREEEVERTQTDHLNKALLSSFAASLDRMGMGACPMLSTMGDSSKGAEGDEEFDD